LQNILVQALWWWDITLRFGAACASSTSRY